LVAHKIALHDVWWAAISAFTVTQAGFGASLYRGLLRVIGTACGAALGFLLGQAIADEKIAFIPLIGIAGWLGLYAALCFRHSYAWILGLVTFVMVMFEAANPSGALAQFAEERFVNVLVGTLACILVAGLADPRWRVMLRRWVAGSSAESRPSAEESSPFHAIVDRREAAWHALTGAVAMLLLSVAGDLVHLRSFPQAVITAVALLIVPLAGGVSDVPAQIRQRMAHRFLGCLAAGLVAGAMLPLIEARPLLCQLTLGIGVWIGAYLQAGPASIRYMGTQFTIAFIMVFVQDRGWAVDSGAALERLAGVFAGVCAVALILQVMTFVRRAFR
jgi:uncharacterized membrane protein YccC